MTLTRFCHLAEQSESGAVLLPPTRRPDSIRAAGRKKTKHQRRHNGRKHTQRESWEESHHLCAQTSHVTNDRKKPPDLQSLILTQQHVVYLPSEGRLKVEEQTVDSSRSALISAEDLRLKMITVKKNQYTHSEMTSVPESSTEMMQSSSVSYLQEKILSEGKVTATRLSAASRGKVFTDDVNHLTVQ